MKFTVKNYFLENANILNKIDIQSVENIIDLIKKAQTEGKKIFTCGNGGSASTASHMITDWNKMTTIATGEKVYGFALTDNIGLITAYANDTDYDNIFKGQLQSVMDEGDYLIAISGSGNSKNVINAVEYANSINATTIGIVGFDGGNLIKKARHSILVPSFDMQVCEDIHLMICHMIMKNLCNAEIISK
jgi:D-sedoheptulose 7-phosphate isomerase